MIRLFKYLFLAVLSIPTLVHPMWISSFGGSLNPEYANAPITQICNAARAGNVDAVKRLIKHVDLDELDPVSGTTVLMKASDGGHSEIVKMLLDAGANTNRRDAGGWSPLRHVIRQGDQQVIKMLIERGADVNYKSYQETLLMSAAEVGNAGSVQQLIDALADLYPVCADGKSALVYASENDNLTACTLLIVDAMLRPAQEQKTDFIHF